MNDRTMAPNLGRFPNPHSPPERNLPYLPQVPEERDFVDALRAAFKAFVRRKGWTTEELAEKLGCEPIDVDKFCSWYMCTPRKAIRALVTVGASAIVEIRGEDT
jgi:hypothetical protein